MFRTKTWLQVFRSWLTKQCLLSCGHGGVGLTLANSCRSLLIVASLLSMSKLVWVKNSPGSLKVLPKVSSAGEQFKSDLNMVLKPNKIIGSSSLQVECLARAFSAAFRVLWKRSTKPFASGWYVVVCILWIPNNFENSAKRLDSNCVPWSVVIVCGIPNLHMNCSNNVTATVCAVMLRIGYASGHLVKRSTTVKR